MSNFHFDLLLRNATLLTAEPEAPIVRNASLGVIGDRIAWIGAEPPAGARAAVDLDLSGRVVTPGFVNVHTHSALSMVRGVAADLGFAPSYTRGIPNALDLSPEEAIAMTRLGALEALLAGSTLIGEHFVHVDACVPEIAKLGLRVYASVRLHDVDFRKVADSGRWEFDAALGDALLERNLALHSSLHGAQDGRIAVQFAAHAADTCSEPYLRRVANAAQGVDAVVNTHLAQSRVEVERVLARTKRTPAQVFEEAGLLNERLLCGHCIYLEAADIERMAKAGAHAVHIPKCNAASGRLAPTPKLKAAGLNITLATDTQHADMVELMRWALATARVQTAGVDDDWQPRHVFDMATINGARALGLEDELGSLKVGKKADLVVFDFRRPHLVPATSPLGNLVHTGMGRDVEMVFVDGRCVVENGRPTLVDMDTVLADARRTANELWRKAAA
jgi:5-methylthioadenosine/S-adenosylhomocysteine deaminase